VNNAISDKMIRMRPETRLIRSASTGHLDRLILALVLGPLQRLEELTAALKGKITFGLHGTAKENHLPPAAPPDRLDPLEY
jgi:hypothetical protein